MLSDQRMPGLDGVWFLAAGQGALSRRQAGAADGLRRYRRGDRRDQPVAGGLLPAEALGSARAAAVSRSSTTCSTTGARTYRPGYGGVRVIGSRYMPTVHQIKDFLARNHVPYEFFDVEATDERGAEARALAEGATLPLVILPGGERLAAPSLGDLARKVGLKREAKGDIYDVAIVGAGPGGLAAAVYAASEGLKTILIDREGPGGQAGIFEPDRELPRVSRRHLGQRPGAARADAGAQVRGRSGRAARRDQRAPRGAVQVPHGAWRRRHGARDRLQGADADDGPGVAAAAGRLHRAVRRARRLLRRPPPPRR